MIEIEKNHSWIAVKPGFVEDEVKYTDDKFGYVKVPLIQVQDNPGYTVHVHVYLFLIKMSDWFRIRFIVFNM